MLTVADAVDVPPSHHNRSQSLIQFSHTDKFFCKLLSKEPDPIGNPRNPSFRVYYGGSTGAVPFTWETTPGTPKLALFRDGDGEATHAVVAPLTPPPSFFSNGDGGGSVRSGSRKVLDRLFMRRFSYSYSSPSRDSASSESSSNADRKTTFRRLRNWRSLSMVRFSMRFGRGGESQVETTSPRLKLSVKRETVTTPFRGCFWM